MSFFLPPVKAKVREIPSAGSHLATLYQLIDLGTQTSPFDNKLRQKIRLGFELLDQYVRDGRPMVIGQEFTMSGDERSNLRKTLESWLGRKLADVEVDKFDLERLLGTVAVLNIVHDVGRSGSTYAKITTIAKPPVGTEPRHYSINPTTILTFANFDHEAYDRLPGFIKTQISNAPEFRRNQRGDLSLTEPTPKPVLPLSGTQGLLSGHMKRREKHRPRNL